MPLPEPFSNKIVAWLQGESAKTFGSLADLFGERAFAVTILLLMFAPALPLPTGGVTHVFEAIAIIVSAEMVLGVRRMWIPNRLRRRDLGASVTAKTIPFMVRRIRWFEQRSRPRWTGVVDSRAFHRICGLVLMVLAIAAALAPPFTGLDTLPALGAVGIALGLILSDIVVIGLGVAIGTGGVLLVLILGAALFEGLGRLL